jgi:signal peptidase I
MNYLNVILVVAIVTGLILLRDFIFLSKNRKAELIQNKDSHVERPHYMSWVELIFTFSALIFVLKSLDFETVLTIAVIITGVLALLEIKVFSKRRNRYADHLAMQYEHCNTPEIQTFFRKPSVLLEYAKSFFPILLIVLILRTFLFEGYRIPSGSLEPTLQVGDLILVNKFDYGLRLPLTHTKIFSIGEPKHGDIAVFYFPPNPKLYFIKRIIGLPGDKISYINKVLYINGKKQDQVLENEFSKILENNQSYKILMKQENFEGIKHGIYRIPSRPGFDLKNIVVPKGMYFAMGDNRDDSDDSRNWGFVPEGNLVGHAIRVLLSLDTNRWHIRWNRIGMKIH